VLQRLCGVQADAWLLLLLLLLLLAGAQGLQQLWTLHRWRWRSSSSSLD
jgi:hypothetical protein